MSANMPNLKQIGGGHRKTLVDVTWNDPYLQVQGCLSVISALVKMDDQALPSEILKRTSHLTLYGKKGNGIVGASSSTHTLACVLTSTLQMDIL